MGDPICDVIVAMMRYSEIPRDLSSDSLRFAADVSKNYNFLELIIIFIQVNIFQVIKYLILNVCFL